MNALKNASEEVNLVDLFMKDQAYVGRYLDSGLVKVKKLKSHHVGECLIEMQDLEPETIHRTVGVAATPVTLISLD